MATPATLPAQDELVELLLCQVRLGKLLAALRARGGSARLLAQIQMIEFGGHGEDWEALPNTAAKHQQLISAGLSEERAARHMVETGAVFRVGLSDTLRSAIGD